MPKLSEISKTKKARYIELDISTKRHPDSVLLLDDGMLEKLIKQHGITSIWPAKIGNTKSLYAITYTEKKKRIAIHRLVLPGMKIIDHENQNPLDNRRENLRKATHGMNMFNRIRTDNTSGHPGVNWNKIQSSWIARIAVNRKEIFLGYFKDINLAIAARKKAELKYYNCLTKPTRRKHE